MEASVRKERIQRYGDQFALTGALGDPVASYSHGMKQKLAIISALIHEPKLMILDEPFVGLDPKATLLLKNTMHEMCQRGAAIFSPPMYWMWRRNSATRLRSSKMENWLFLERWSRS